MSVLQLDLGVGRTLAGLHGLRLDRDPQPALVLDDVAGANLVAVDFHGMPCESGIWSGPPLRT